MEIVQRISRPFRKFEPLRRVRAQVVIPGRPLEAASAARPLLLSHTSGGGLCFIKPMPEASSLMKARPLSSAFTTYSEAELC